MLSTPLIQTAAWPLSELHVEQALLTSTPLAQIAVTSRPAPTGRERELSVLLGEYEAAKDTGRARLVLVEGPSGIGKSHLLSAFQERLRQLGSTVLTADSAREHRSAPFGLFVPLLPRLHQNLGDDGATPSARGAWQLAAGLGEPLQDAEARGVLIDAVIDVFLNVARDGGAFIFPDVDAADAGSVELLGRLLRAVGTPGAEANGLWVVSCRAAKALPSSLARVLSRLPVTTVSLDGLALDSVRSYLGQAEVAESVHALTQGNPARLEALLTGFSEGPVNFSARRLETLSRTLRSVLEGLAAAGAPMDGEMVLEVSGLPSGAGLLEALERERWLVATPSSAGLRYRFLREDDRAYLVERTPAGRLDVLRRAWAVTCERADDWATAARLWFELVAVEAGPAAVRAAQAFERVGALEEAANHYQRAASVLSGVEQQQAWADQARLDSRLGRFRAVARTRLKLYRLSGDGAHGLAAGRALLELGRLRAVEAVLAALPEASTQGPGWVVLNAERWLRRGDGVRAKAEAQAALGQQTLSPETEYALRTVLGKAALLQGDDAKALRWFSLNAEHALAHGLDAAWGQAKLNQGVAAQRLGDVAQAAEHYRQVPAQSGPTYARAQANLGSLQVEAGDFEPALEALTAALRTFARYQMSREVALTASNLSRLYLSLGDLTRAAELAEHGHRLATALQDSALLAQAALNLGAVALERGDGKTAWEALEKTRAGFLNVGHRGYAALASALQGRALWLLGERAPLKALLERADSVDDFGPASLEVQLLKTELALDEGDLHAASRSMMRAREVLLSHADVEGNYRIDFLTGRFKLLAGDEAGASVEFRRAGARLGELVQRVPVIYRTGFLAIPRRAQVWTWAHPASRVVAPPPSVMPVVTARTAVLEHGLVGNSGPLRAVVAQVAAVGRAPTTVLIRGESGTGKELLAQALHDHSPRFGHPLVKVNCSAMVEDLLLSELFGHEKGSFTGAVRERKGRFELADGGTLFLDEIGDISPRCQVALLRVLQEREFERVGGTKTVRVDVRVICATNRDLEAMIARGQFREDLYYRLKGVMLKLPSLRERIEDLPLLAKHFLDRNARASGQPVKHLSAEAQGLLLKHAWPGNVRELENVLAAAVIFSDGPSIEVEALMHVDELKALATGSAGDAGAQAKGALAEVDGRVDVAAPLDFYALAQRRGLSMRQLREEMETQCIARALEEGGGNISEAARKLGMKRSRLSQIINANPVLKEVANDQS